ncbi:hypothetical protein vec13_15 [Escherichia phage Vec13]|uniref:Nucleotide kinase n=1 Tax=Escherichia phage Vec13 TaxID=2783859 RepID=A0A345AQE6_9CAUD|nr:nucleotide kinase [Escherichia phage Vec13]AXF38897.1 hypothetical protein vec13_15 [Escherichia phage Vec13]
MTYCDSTTYCEACNGDDRFPHVGKLVGNKLQEIDGVRKPSHYKVFDGVESIEIIARSMTVSEFRGFCMGNVLKYRLRAGKKSELATMEKDMAKAEFYGELYEKHKDKCYDA